MALNITTGVSIPVTRDDKEVGVLHFNPNDDRPLRRPRLQVCGTGRR